MKDMDHAEKQQQRLIKKGTQWLLFLLLINIGLHLDGVEAFFSSSSQQSQVVLKTEGICGSVTMTTQGGACPSYRSYGAISSGLVNSSLEKLIVSGVLFDLELISLALDYLDFNDQIYSQKVYGQFSGLSPPQAPVSAFFFI